MSLALSPLELSAWQSVFFHFRRWRLKGNWHRLFTALRAAERERVGRDAEPSAAIIDSQSAKTVAESASISGFDTHKHSKGRKQHLFVDTLGLPLSIYVTPADAHDTKGARCILAGLAPLVPRLKKIWLVQSGGQLGPRRSGTCPWCAWFQHSTSPMGG